MAWPGIHTWVVGDAWPVTDANTYISNALASIRRYQNSSGQFMFTSTGGNIATTAETQIGPSFFNLLSSTPDENYRMVVIVDVEASTDSGGTWAANAFNINVYDQAGTQIATRRNSIASGVDIEMTVVCGASYTGGTNNGFRVTAVPANATNMWFTIWATVFFAPAV